MIRKALSIFRKAIIVVLTLAAVGTGYLWVESHSNPRTWTWTTLPKLVHLVFRRSCENRVRITDGTLCLRHHALLDGNGTFTPNWQKFAGFRWVTYYQRPVRTSHHLDFFQSDEVMALGEKREVWPEVSRLYKKQLWDVDIEVPLWAFVAGFAAYPTVAFIRGPLRLYRRRKRGLCVTFGYDLRGTTGGVCSECGKETVKP